MTCMGLPPPWFLPLAFLIGFSGTFSFGLLPVVSPCPRPNFFMSLAGFCQKPLLNAPYPPFCTPFAFLPFWTQRHPVAFGANGGLLPSLICPCLFILLWHFTGPGFIFPCDKLYSLLRFPGVVIGRFNLSFFLVGVLFQSRRNEMTCCCPRRLSSPCVTLLCSSSCRVNVFAAVISFAGSQPRFKGTF